MWEEREPLSVLFARWILENMWPHHFGVNARLQTLVHRINCRLHGQIFEAKRTNARCLRAHMARWVLLCRSRVESRTRVDLMVEHANHFRKSDAFSWWRRQFIKQQVMCCLLVASSIHKAAGNVLSLGGVVNS